MKSRLLTQLAPVLTIAILAACGPRWVIIQQGPADKFANKPAFTVLPVDFSGNQINNQPEAQALAAMDAKAQAEWTEIKPNFAAAFEKFLTTKATAEGLGVTPGAQAGAGLVIKPMVISMLPGKFVGIMQSPSLVTMNVEIAGADGQLIDKVQFTHETPGSVYNATTKLRIQKDGEEIGEMLGAYLATRTK